MSTVAVGDVVQIRPNERENFGGCFMVVEEVKSWGLMGYCQVPAGGVAYYRVRAPDYYRIGRAEWLLEEDPA